jgi:hypothetical protein
MLRKQYFVFGFLLVGCFGSCTRSEVEEEGPSWKYLVERTVIDWDGLTNKKKTHIDRAFVHYGAGAEQAGGQVKEVPQVVYIHADRSVRAKPSYFESPFVPRDSEKLTLSGKFPGNQGLHRDSPLPLPGLPKAFEIFPLKPEAELRKKSRWNCTWYLTIDDYTPEVMFPATISHEVTGYKKKQGRRCAVIEYTISGEFKSVEQPVLLSQAYRGEWHLKGNGTAYFDPAEEIIVKKEQTISRTSRSERLERLEYGSIGWVPTEDRERTVTISVSLIPEERPKSRLLVYLLIAGGAGIVVAGVVLVLRRKGSSSIQ